MSMESDKAGTDHRRQRGLLVTVYIPICAADELFRRQFGIKVETSVQNVAMGFMDAIHCRRIAFDVDSS